MKKRLIFTEESNLQEVCVKDKKDEKDRKREVQVERNIFLLLFLLFPLETWLSWQQIFLAMQWFT